MKIKLACKVNYWLFANSPKKYLMVNQFLNPLTFVEPEDGNDIINRL